MDTDSILTQFCNDDRPYTRRPWSYEGYIVATNGRIICRLHSDAYEGKFAENDDTQLPKLLTPFGLTKPLPEPIIFNADDLIITDSEQLKSLALQKVDCDYCGDGVCECSCGDNHPCGYCGGTGDSLSAPEKYAVLGSGAFRYAYLELVFNAAKHFSNGTFSMTADGGHSAPTLFQAGDAEIALMPVAKAVRENKIFLEKEKV